MKLNSHQRKIVSRINRGEIYDIPSYLRSFHKGKVEKYDMDFIRKKFNEDEAGKEYKVMKKGYSSYIYSYVDQNFSGVKVTTPLALPRKLSDISDDEWEYKKAVLDENITALEYNYADQRFKFDFKDEGVFIANNFEEILDFVSLWSYLKHEALIFEVSRPILQEEISIFYESSPKKTENTKDKKVEQNWKKGSLDQIFESLAVDFFQDVPTRSALKYLDVEWKINEEHLIMCREFIGKKFYATSALHSYAAHNYKTVEELDRLRSISIATFALLVSVMAFAYNVMFPTYLEDIKAINQQISGISEEISKIHINQMSSEDLESINECLDEMKSSLEEIKQSSSSNDIKKLEKSVSEIKSLLDK